MKTVGNDHLYIGIDSDVSNEAHVKTIKEGATYWDVPDAKFGAQFGWVMTIVPILAGVFFTLQSGCLCPLFICLASLIGILGLVMVYTEKRKFRQVEPLHDHHVDLRHHTRVREVIAELGHDQRLTGSGLWPHEVFLRYIREGHDEKNNGRVEAYIGGISGDPESITRLIANAVLTPTITKQHIS